jgi:U6 snRNA phosphodiesterase
MHSPVHSYHLHRFTASFASFASLDNDERTRTFLAMEIGAGHTEVCDTCSDMFSFHLMSPQLKALSDALTPTLKAIRQKEFYPEPRFHASFAWALLDACRSGSTTPALRSTPPATEDAPPSSSAPAFSTIPHFPPSLVPALNASYGSQLAERRAGIFEVDQIRVRIGKDVVGWRLGAV